MQNLTKKIDIRISTAKFSVLGPEWNSKRLSPELRYIPETRLYLPRAGRGCIHYQGKDFELRRGVMLLIPPFAGITAECPEHLEKYWCHFSAVAEDTANDVFSLFSCPVEIKLEKKEEGFHFELFERLAARCNPPEESAADSFAGSLAASSILILLLERFFAQLPRETMPEQGKGIMMKVIRYMHRNLDSGADLNVFAREAGLHPTYFSALFRRCIGSSPVAYFNHLKMNFAMSELRKGNDRIGEIAEKIGISSPVVFSRFFRSRAGVSPREYRKYFTGGER